VPLVYACVAPHGGEAIPVLAGRKAKLFAPTTAGLRTLARDMKAARPDTVVIATPHNLRMPKHIGVVISENSTGEVTEGGKTVRLGAKCDLDFGEKVIAEAEKKGLPVAGANYGALEGPLSDLAMDWGTLVPLWFFLRWKPRPRVLIVTPSRGIPLDENFEFGGAVARVAEQGKKRVAFVASADQAHAHSKSGPYGFNRRAAEYDRLVVEAVSRGRLEALLQIDPGLVEGAKPDSLWQMTMLAGAVSVVPMEGRVVSYQVPQYYGMLCASYLPRIA
jgi:aromatic ring-opening dioxygenase LigB subunit